MSDKFLKIGTSFDGAGIAKVEAALKRLKKEGVEVSKAFKGINIGSGHGNALFAKSIVDSSDKMKKFRGVSEDTSRSLKTILGKTLTEEQEKLKHYTSRVEVLSRAYQKQQKILQQFKEQGGSPYAMKAAEMRSQRFGGALIAAQTSKESYQDSVKELIKDPSVLGPIMKAMGIVGTVAGAIATGAAVYQANKTVQTGNLATVGGGVGGVLGSLMGNPAAMGSALMGNYTMPDGTKVNAADLLRKSQGVGAIYTRDILGQGAAGAAGGAAAGAGIGAFFGGVGALPGSAIGGALGGLGGMGRALYQNYFQGGARAEEAQKVQEQLGNLQGMNPLENLVSSNLQATAGVRLAAARRLGGQGMGIAGVGAGVGSDLNESLSLGMGLSERFGARNTVGSNGYAAQALRGQQQGLSSEFTGNFLGSLGSASANGSEVLKKILSEAVKQGMGSLDVQFFEKIGGAVAKSAITAGGAIGTQGASNLSAAFMGGITGGGTAAGMHAADIRQSGIAGLDKLSAIPAVHFAKMAMAKRLLGADASGAQILALANASPQELIAGDSTRLKELGLGGSEHEAARMGVLRGGLESGLMGLTGNGGSKEALRLKAMMSGPGGMKAAFANPEFAQLAGAILSTATGMTQEEAQGAFGLVAHSGDKLTGANRALPKIHGGLAETQRVTSAVQSLELIGQESKKTAEGLSLAATAFKQFATIFHDVDIESGKQLADLLAKFIDTMTQKRPGSKPTEHKTKGVSPTTPGVPQHGVQRPPHF